MNFDFLTEHLPLLRYANYPGTMYLQRFKEMKEMHGGSSRDDRQKREQLRQEREMAKFAQMYPLIYSCTNYYSLLPVLCFFFLFLFTVVSMTF